MVRSTPGFLKMVTPRRGESSKAQGDETRRRIVSAAVEVFATRGYDGAGTREIAAEADVNLASLTYYFGGKPALYKAAIDYVIARIDDILRPSAEHVSEVLAAGTWNGDTDEQLFQLLFELLDHWLDLNLGRSGRQWNNQWRNLLARAEVEPPTGDVWIYRTTTDLVLTPATCIVRHLLRAELDDERCILLALSILGQVQFFKPQRDGQVPALDWSSMTDERYEAVKSMIRSNTRKLLQR